MTVFSNPWMTQVAQLVADLANHDVAQASNEQSMALLERYCWFVRAHMAASVGTELHAPAIESAMATLRLALEDERNAAKVLERAHLHAVEFTDGLLSKRGLPVTFFHESAADLRFVVGPTGRVEIAREVLLGRASYPRLLFYLLLRLGRQTPVRRCLRCKKVFASRGSRRWCTDSCAQRTYDQKRSGEERRVSNAEAARRSRAKKRRQTQGTTAGNRV